MESIFAGAVYAITGALFLHLAREHRASSPVFWWLFAMGLIAIGTFVLIDLSHPSDAAHLAAFLIAICTFALSCLVYSSRFGVRHALQLYRQRPEEPDTSDAVTMTALLLLVSAVVTIVYFYLLGFNLFVLLLTGSVGDYSGMRLSMYSGDEYFAPGYVNQFKNTLYPLTATAVVIWVRRRGSRFAWPLTTALVGFGVFALLGTGQRAYILFAMFAAVYGVHLLSMGQGRSFLMRKALLVMLPAFGLFTVLTIAYRDIEGAGAGEVISEIAERFLRVQQEGGLIGFRYIAERDTPWFAEWAKGLIGIIPGREGSTIAHEIHGEVYGSTQGTIPLTAVGSAYQNGGLAAVGMLFWALGFVYSLLYHRFLSGARTVLRSVAYGVLFFYLATYVVGPPESLIDAGAVTVVIFLLLRKLRWLPGPRLRSEVRSFQPAPQGRPMV